MRGFPWVIPISLRLKSHHEMGAMGFEKRLSFALESDDVRANNLQRYNTSLSIRQSEEVITYEDQRKRRMDGLTPRGSASESKETKGQPSLSSKISKNARTKINIAGQRDVRRRQSNQRLSAKRIELVEKQTQLAAQCLD